MPTTRIRHSRPAHCARNRSTPFVLLCLFAAPAVAQCSVGWTAGEGVPGVNRSVRAMQRWDPDGAGPATPVVVVGGDMLLADRTPVNHIAAFDPATGLWQSLGVGTNGPVTCLLELPNGHLLVGGVFTMAGGVAANYLAEWDGTAWSPFAGGVDSGVFALCNAPNGDVVAAGHFGTAGGVPALRIARWDGAVWHPLGSGLPHFVLAVAAMANGDVIAGGTFVGGNLQRIARWDGTAWSPLGAGPDGIVRTLQVRANGDLLVGGALYFGGTTTYGLATWNGTVWTPMPGCPQPIHAVAETPGGDLFVGGSFPGIAVGQFRPSLAHWNGAVWDSMGSGADGQVDAVVALPNGEVLAGGQFGVVDGVPASRIARWNGANWSHLGAGQLSLPLRTAVFLANGELVVAGQGLLPAVQRTGQVARWNAQGLSLLGSAPLGFLTCMQGTTAGELVVAGTFSSIQGVAANNIARWDGAAWHAMGAGLPEVPMALAELPNGDLVAAGMFSGYGVVRWDGTAWSSLGTPPFTHAVDLLVTGAGHVVCATDYWVHRWDGATWTMLPPPGPRIRQLAELRNGDLVVVGDHWQQPGAHVLRFDGSNWQPLATGMDASARCAHVLPNGDLLVGGDFTTIQGTPARCVARWDGSVWSPVANGLDGPPTAFVPTPNGDVLVLGDFAAAGGQVSAFTTRLVPSCQATRTVYGPGCPGPNGDHPLAVDLPWLGGVFGATVSNVPATSFVLAFQSFVPVTLPLPLVLPQASPGCTLHVAPEFHALLLAQQGRARLSFMLPNSSSLVGVDFHHQMLVVDVAGGGGIASVSATDALRLRVGQF